MDYKNIECDFISRTLEIVKQYDTIVMQTVPPDKQFEVTLLVNCLLGLVVLPFEHKKRMQRNIRFPEICKVDQTAIKDLDEKWGLKNIQIKKFVLDGKEVNADKRSLRIFTAMLRHSTAHSQFGDGLVPNKSKPKGVSVDYKESSIPSLTSQITKVNFVNIYNTTNFKASIAVEDLKIFATELASVVLAEMGCSSKE